MAQSEQMIAVTDAAYYEVVFAGGGYARPEFVGFSGSAHPS
jgi:hypothetical protein